MTSLLFDITPASKNSTLFFAATPILGVTPEE